jgi:hypothetical protein
MKTYSERNESMTSQKLLSRGEGHRVRVLLGWFALLAVVLGGYLWASPSFARANSSVDTKTPVCGYLFEWAHAWRFPLQPDPHAAYSYVIPAVTKEPVAYVVSGDFPFAAWTSWMIYDEMAKPFSVANDTKITPDPGNVNPFVPGTPVLSSNRHFELLILPSGVNPSSIAPSLQNIPASNILPSPTYENGFAIVNRVYNAFPGYNQGGSGGPTIHLSL